MANWEQILTSGTGIGKLSDVTLDENNLDDGDILILNSSDVWVNHNITGTTDEVDITLGSGTVQVGLPTNVKVAGTLDIGGGAGTTGATISSAGAITADANITVNAANGADAELTLNGGATDKGAIINMYADAGDETIEKWEIKVANGGVLTFDNGANTEDAMAKFTPHATSDSAKLEVAGQLHVLGNKLKLGGDTSFDYTTNKLTITEGTVEVSDAFVAGVSILSPTIQGSTNIQTPLIEYTDGTDALTIASNGKVTSSGDIQVGTSLQTATIDYTDGDLAITIADGGAITTSGNATVTGDLTVTGNTLTFGNGETIDNETDGTVLVTAPALKVSGDLNVVGNDIEFGTGISTARLKCAASTGTDQPGTDVAIRAGQGTGTGEGGEITFQVANGAGSTGTTANSLATAMTIKDDKDVEMAANLTVSGNLQVDGATTTVNTETILLADAIIHLNFGLGSGEPAYDAGLKVDRGNATDVGLFWDESADAAVSATSIEASTSFGGAWAMGSGDSGLGADVNFGTIHGWLVGVTHDTSGTEAADERSTGLGSLFVNTTTNAVYMRVE